MRKTAAKAAIAPIAGETRTPLYQQVVVVLRDEILKGLHPVGSQLPTEGELVERFGVSRHTVREALRALRSDGLVSSRQGAGTTVARPGAKAYVQEIQSFADLIQYATTIRFRVDRTDVVVSDAALATQIGGEVGQKWLCIEGLRFEEGNVKPMCRTVVYVHTDYAGVGRLAGRRSGPIYELIEDLYGLQIAEVEQHIRACPIPQDVAPRLQLGTDEFVVEVRRVYRTSSRKVAQVAISLYPTERFTFAMTLRRTDT